MAGKGNKAKQIATLEDDATAREQELRQIEEKNNFLEQQVEKTRQLLAIKNKLIAEKIAAVNSNAVQDVTPAPQKPQLVVLIGALITLIGAVWLYLRPRLRRFSAPSVPI